MTDRLYRSSTDRVIAGVAGGMAVWLNIDPSLVRIGWVLLAIFSGGIFVLVYLLMMIVVPLPPPGWVPQRPPAPGAAAWSAAGSSGGWSEPGATPPAPGAPAGEPGGPSSPPPGPGSTPGSWTTPPPRSDWPQPSGGRGAGIVLGAVLVVIGVWFLAGRYINIDWAMVWPIAVVLLGVGFIAASIRRSPPGGAG